jgi:RNA polymerase sigma-70 factor, ECF subfamily
MSFQLHAFDLPYLERLRCGDVLTQEHFADYFSQFIRVKLGRRLHSHPVIDDVRQETFVRVWVALRKDKGIRQPERFGSFVNSVCNNVLREHNRAPFARAESENAIADSLTDTATGIVDILAARQLRQQVERILAELPVQHRDLIRKFFWEEHDRDELCRDFGVSRQYLRVLLHRAIRQFKKLYLERSHSTIAEMPRKM